MDRLSALMSRFALNVSPVSSDTANFVIVKCAREKLCVRLLPEGQMLDIEDGECVVFSAHVDWGGVRNPLLSTLPSTIEQPITEDLEAIVALLLSETKTPRCGSASVLNRLGEVLIVALLREQLSTGEAPVGLMGGLADKRIARAIVAIHDQPEYDWCNAQLSDVAGLSPSRFSELFSEKVGETPATYLRRWRLILARQDIERGDRVQTVAWRYCYKSSEALARAFRRTFGETPTGRPISSTD